MTYTFKLSRRLAVLRTLTTLPVLLWLVACSEGDAIAPEGSLGNHPTSDVQDGWKRRAITPVAVSIKPSLVTVETNQLIRFLAHGLNRAGDSVGAPVTWSTTGGTILPDGRFSSAAVGSFMVTARTRIRNEDRIDSATVQVVRRQPLLASIRVAPGNTTLASGASQQFFVVGRMRDGRAAPVGSLWQATGGTIDVGGHYVAGDTAGTFHVVATNPLITLSDTVAVTIVPSAPPAFPPAPTAPDSLISIPTLPLPGSTPPESTPPTPPAPTPTPVLQKVFLVPSSATLAWGATRQFVAYGKTTTGDSIGFSGVYLPTGGSVTKSGSGMLYSAGWTNGSFRLIATTGTLADTSFITVTAPLGSSSGSGSGIPFGPFDGWSGSQLQPGTDAFPASFGGISADGIVARINAARAKKVKLAFALTGGKHTNYLTNGVFDRAKWNAKMDSYNTPAIKAAVAAGVADGTIIGNSVMDEPHVHGSGADANTWGPAGTMTKARVDSLCGYVKAIFPTLPVGAVHRHDIFEPTKSYRVCDFIGSQYSARLGDVAAFRNGGVAMAQRDGVAIMFSMNILNGGPQDKDGTWDCPLETSGGRGQNAPNCRMSSQQIRDWGMLLGPAGCGLLMWRYDPKFMAKPENQQAFRDIAARLAAAPAKSCRKS